MDNETGGTRERSERRHVFAAHHGGGQALRLKRNFHWHVAPLCLLGAGAEAGQTVIAAFQDVWEEPIDEEATV